MKQLFLTLLIIPVAGLNRTALYNDKTVEIRTGQWPIMLQRNIEQSDTTYSLQFRDEQVLTSQVMDTLSFPDLSQLKYFEKALTTLKTGHTGDIARFKNYSVARADKKYEGISYVLRLKWTLTNFKQSEADAMINTIRTLKF